MRPLRIGGGLRTSRRSGPMGVSQPVFSMLKGNPSSWSYRLDSDGRDRLRRAGRGDTALLVVAMEALASLVSRTLAGSLYIVGVWCFGFLAALQLIRLFNPEQGG